MAPALPGQLGPVRLPGWQRFPSVKGGCPVGGGPASLGSAWGSLCPACFVLTPRVGEVEMGQQFCRSAFLSVPSCSPLSVPQTCSRIHKHTHPKLTLTETNTLLHWYTHTHTQAYMHSGIHTLFWPHTHTCSLTLSVSFSVSRAFVLDVRVRQSAVYTLSPSSFLAAAPSLQSPFHSKQNKVKSNTDLMWLLQENLKYVLFQSLHFPSQISHLACHTDEISHVRCFWDRHTFFRRNWKQLFCCWD